MGILMARAIWKGCDQLSLVHVPVSLHTAARPHEPRPPHAGRARLLAGRISAHQQEPGRSAVEWRDIVKGYEYRKGDYVVLTDEGLPAANVGVAHC
mgnify:CR=1 FL=1